MKRAESLDDEGKELKGRQQKIFEEWSRDEERRCPADEGKQLSWRQQAIGLTKKGVEMKREESPTDEGKELSGRLQKTSVERSIDDEKRKPR